mgnify:CR=1 FL=1
MDPMSNAIEETREQGYAVIPDFLRPGQLAAATEAMAEIEAESGFGEKAYGGLPPPVDQPALAGISKLAKTPGGEGGGEGGGGEGGGGRGGGKGGGPIGTAEPELELDPP